MRLNAPGSEASKSIYKSPTDIKLPPADKLAQFRQLVGGAKVGIVNIGEAAGKVGLFLSLLYLFTYHPVQHVEEDFVRERAATTGLGFTADDLVQRMLVSRCGK